MSGSQSRPDRGESSNVSLHGRAKAFLLLEIRPGFVDEARKTILAQRGVVSADIIAGPPDIIVTTEADTFDELVRQSIDALVSVEAFTTIVKCLAAR